MKTKLNRNRPTRTACPGLLTSILAATLFAGIMMPKPAQSQTEQSSNLNISPKRVVFSSRVAASAIYILNRGDQAVTYRIELVDRVMSPNGEIRTIAELADDAESKPRVSRMKSSADMIQFTPRRVTLAPGQTQAIRLRLLRPADLPDGEYRTTLTVSALPPEDTGLTVDQAVGEGDDKFSMRAIALFGISIPLIVRQGQLSTVVKIDQARASGDKVRLSLVREGLGSVYGDLEVREKDAKGQILGIIHGIGVYNEIDNRVVEISLNRPVEAGEVLYLSFRDDAISDGLASAVEQISVK